MRNMKTQHLISVGLVLLTGVASAWAEPRGTQESVATRPESGVAVTQEQKQVYSIRLKYTNATEVVALIERLLPVGKVIADKQTNSIILSTTPEAYRQAVALVKELDVPAVPHVVKVFPLKRIRPESAACVLEAMDRDLKVAADEKSGAVVVQGSEAALKMVAEVLAQLDVQPKASSAEPSMNIIKLGPRFQINAALEQTLKMAMEGVGTFTADPARNTIAIKAPPEVMAQVGRIIAEMEKQPVRAEDQRSRLRVVWLVGKQDGSPVKHPKGQELPLPPEDMKPVVEELQGLGLKGLGLAANLMVASAGGNYKMSASPFLPMGDQELVCSLMLSGQVRSGDQSEKEVDFELSVTADMNIGETRVLNKRVTLASLNTTMKAPLGHSVVLGSVPIGDLNSVFVLQLLAGE